MPQPRGYGGSSPASRSEGQCGGTCSGSKSRKNQDIPYRSHVHDGHASQFDSLFGATNSVVFTRASTIEGLASTTEVAHHHPATPKAFHSTPLATCRCSDGDRTTMGVGPPVKPIDGLSDHACPQGRNQHIERRTRTPFDTGLAWRFLPNS